jgi:hypothetical protein
MRWACGDPAEIIGWRPGGRLLATHTLTSLPSAMFEQLPVECRQMLTGLAGQRLPQVEEYRINLVQLP